MKLIHYSIIVPSYNRKDEIKELIASFEKLDFPTDRYELIIVDDGSTDGTAEFVADHISRHRLPLKYYSQQNQGPGAARNLGMEKATGNFFIFVDSDCTVDSTWLSEIDTTLQQNKIDAFGGPDSFRNDFPPLLKAINYSMTSFLTTGGIRGHGKKKAGKFYPRSFNMGLSRPLHEKIGGFGALRHGQDIEFSNRIIKSGARVVRIQNAIVYHKRRTSITKFFRQVYNWGVARINLFKTDKAMLEPVHFFPALGLLTTVFLLLLGILFPKITLAFFGIGLLFLIFSVIDAFILYKNLHAATLVFLIIPIQIYGYGLGFTIAFVKRVILRKKEFTGFTRKYY